MQDEDSCLSLDAKDIPRLIWCAGRRFAEGEFLWSGCGYHRAI